MMYYKHYVNNNTKKYILTRYNIFKFKFKIIFNFIKLCFNIMWFKFFQMSIWKNIQHISKNIFELTFEISGKLYKVRFKIKKGPNKILQCNDKYQNDVTILVEPYLNFQDLDIINILPSDLNINDLNIELYNGTSKKIKYNEIINL